MSQTKRKISAALGSWALSGIIGVLILQPGCSSPPRTGPAPAAASVSVPAAPLSELSPTEPIYRNPKIGVVYLRAHQDEEGRLLGPQVMYQVVEAGGWNVDAAEQGQGYIPSVNQETPAEAAPPSPEDSPWLDPKEAARVIITGLMDPDDKDQAEAMARQAGGGRTAVFDDQAGWLLVPGRAGSPVSSAH